jgi:C1A family cysteine protease
MSVSPDADMDCSKESECEYDSTPYSDVDMHMQDDLDPPDGGELDGNFDTGQVTADKTEEVEEEEEEMAQHENEGEDDDNGKEPQTIGQAGMVNTSAENVGNWVDDQPILLPEQGQEMYKHSPWLQSQAPA